MLLVVRDCWFIRSGLAVDGDAEKLYAVDGNTHTLFSCDFDGSKLTVLLTDAIKLQHPFAVAVYKVTPYGTVHPPRPAYNACMLV